MPDYKKCLGTNMDSALVKTAMKQFNEQHFMIVKQDNTKYVINSSAAEGDFYVDQCAGKKITVDHVKQEIV